MMPVAATPLVGLGAELLVLAAVAGMAAYGWRHGLFLAIIGGLQLLGSFLAAIAFAHPLAAGLEPLGCPAAFSLPVAFGLIFAGVVVGVRLAVGGLVPEGVVRFEPRIDQIAGGGFGAVAGVILAGAILVGWSLVSLPDWVRLEPDRLKLDAGTRMLRTFAQAAAGDGGARSVLLDGEAIGAAGAAPGLRCSEPFVDENGNGRRDPVSAADAAAVGPAERYLDLDGNGEFSAAIPFADRDGDGRRAIGLRDCYRIADWRRVAIMHAPRITSGDGGDLPETHPVAEPIYEARAVDVDKGDTIRFAIKPVEGEDGADVAIDPVTGAVTLVAEADFETKKRHVFTVLVTDQAGLTAEKQVTVRVRDVPLE
jgi:hypothetical protein